MTYSEKLKDPRWKKKRLKDGRKDSPLHCHHSYYTKGKEPWQYPDGSIICIYQGCHEKIHGHPKQEMRPIGSLPIPAAVELPVARSRFAALRAAIERADKEKQGRDSETRP